MVCVMVGARIDILLLCFVYMSLRFPFSTLVPDIMTEVYGRLFPTQHLSP